MLKKRPHLEFRNLSLMVFFAVTLFDFHAKAGAEHQIAPPDIPQVSANATSVDLDIFVLNTFLRPTPLSVGDENECRAERIADRIASSMDLPDITVFTEAFSEDSVGTMTRTLRSKYPYFNVRQPERRGTALTNGGLAIFSRFPVERWTTKTFDQCAGWLTGKGDCSASKGVLHALVRVTDRLKVNVLATHLDAGGRQADRAARTSQLAQIREFMAGIDDLNDWPTVFAGDFNIDGDDYEEPGDSEYGHMWSSLGQPVDAFRYARGAWTRTRKAFQEVNTLNCRGGGIVGCREIDTPEHWRAASRLDYVFVTPEPPMKLARLEIRNTTHDSLRDNACSTRFLSDHRAVRTKLRLAH